MLTSGVHRLIEHHAAVACDSIALVDGDHTLAYGQLNQRANVVARCLIDHGFRRGSVAVVRMPRSLELAVVLLGVLKAGGAYTWIENGDSSWPPGVSLLVDDRGGEPRYVALDMTRPAAAATVRSPNLPILTRPTDIACVLPAANGSPGVHVPHSAIVSLLTPVVPDSPQWREDPGAFDLWVALMAGATTVLATECVAGAAA